MCWAGTLENKQRKIRKSESCYKIVRSDLISIFYGFQYEVGKTYSIPYLKPSSINNSSRIEIEKGFHFYITSFSLNSLIPPIGSVILVCKIPNDAEYYINWFGEGVTNKIIIKEIIQDYENR